MEVIDFHYPDDKDKGLVDVELMGVENHRNAILIIPIKEFEAGTIKKGDLVTVTITKHHPPPGM